jgi:hypothetical protein
MNNTIYKNIALLCLLYQVNLFFLFIEHSDSEASLAVINGTLQGKIVLPGDTIYHVVPSSWLFKSVPYFHTVIYSEKDYIW